MERLGQGETVVVDLDLFMAMDAREGGCPCPICEKLRAAYARRSPRGDSTLGRRGRTLSDRPAAEQLLERPGALLTRTDLRELGLTRTMVDAVFRELAVVVFPGSRRPAVKREDYLELVERCTYRDDRVRPT
jgi:hypothetical protein